MFTRLKEEFRERSQPIVSLLHSSGLTPNQVTIVGFFFAILSSVLYYLGRAEAYLVQLGGLSLLASGLCDAFDGALAEAYGQTTLFGGILDSTLDRLVEAVVISSIILAGLCSPGVGLLALVSSFTVSYIRSRAEIEGIKMNNIGIAERAERILVLTVASFFQELDIGVAILAVLSIITVIQRLIHVARVSDYTISSAPRKPL
jgi:archaetidylinositol phosphate synthase